MMCRKRKKQYSTKVGCSLILQIKFWIANKSGEISRWMGSVVPMGHIYSYNCGGSGASSSCCSNSGCNNNLSTTKSI